MRTLTKKATGWLLAGTLAVSSLTLPVTASAFDVYGDLDAAPTGGEMLADAFLVRPFMLVGTVATTATFIVTLPFSLLGGNVGDAAPALVVEPAAYTFVRPLGDM